MSQEVDAVNLELSELSSFNVRRLCSKRLVGRSCVDVRLELVRHGELDGSIKVAINLCLCFLTHETCSLPRAAVVGESLPLDIVFCSLVPISCTDDTFNLLVIDEGGKEGLAIEVPLLPVLGRDVWVLRQADLYLDGFAEVVFKATEAFVGSELGPSMPRSMKMCLTLPFDLLLVSVTVFIHVIGLTRT